MKKTITFSTWLVLCSLSLNAQDITRQASFIIANSGDTKLTTFIRKLEWTPFNDANNIFATSYTKMIRPVSGSAMVNTIRDNAHDLICYQPILPGYKSTAGWMNEDVDTSRSSGSGNNAVIFGGCQCNAPGYGCQTTTCAQSCEIYCSSKHNHGHGHK